MLEFGLLLKAHSRLIQQREQSLVYCLVPLLFLSLADLLIFETIIFSLLARTMLATASARVKGACSSKIRVETHINTGLSVDTVSSLIIGSQAAVLIDMPMAVPQAKALADWLRNTTDKPLMALHDALSP